MATLSKAPPRLLVVEDESIVRRVVVSQLRRAGYDVIEAGTAEEALERAEHDQDVDLVLTDVLMPGLNGRQLVERLRRLRPDLPAVYMSGYPADVITQKGILEPGIEFIEKCDLFTALVPRITSLVGPAAR